MNIKNTIKNLFLTTRLYLLIGFCCVVFISSFFLSIIYEAAIFIFSIAILFSIADFIVLFFSKKSISGRRIVPVRFSLGDENVVTIVLQNNYPFKTQLVIIDELPVQFQDRSFLKKIFIQKGKEVLVNIALRPVSRGEYMFGKLFAFAKSPLSLLQYRIEIADSVSVKTYPSFQQLKKYQLLAVSDNQHNGIKKIRRLGHSLEFEKIKDYVHGDDVRTINWKATARRDTLMVNTFTDARQQMIYALIDKGRAMKMPFEGMTLLDYAINATLALLNVVLLKQDRAGLVCFANKINDIIAADKRRGQLNLLMEGLYRQQTDFLESDYEQLWNITHKRITQRSLLLLFTNFETMAALERQLPYLRKLAERHLLCIIFFENTLLKDINDTQPDSIEGIYIKTIADRFSYEKKQIVKELRRFGILSVLTTPSQLSIDVINKYLELKARQMI